MNSISVFLFCIVFSLKQYAIYCDYTVMYMGCYRGNFGESIRSQGSFNQPLTPELCNDFCFGRRYPYAGTKNGRHCYCSEREPPENLKTKESMCNTVCPGDTSKVCGSTNKLSVYYNAAPETSDTGEVQRSVWSPYRHYPDPRTSLYIPGFPRIRVYIIRGDSSKPFRCFGDSIADRILSDQMFGLRQLTKQKCINRCTGKGYRYAGIENGMYCFCGNTEPSANRQVKWSECNVLCNGNPLDNCGGLWRLAVYSTGVIPPVYSTGVIPQETVPPIVSTTQMPCATSETIISGRDGVCKGAVIFEDRFTSPSNYNWKHVVMMPDNSELEFAVFNSDRKNSYTTVNGLVIKPTVFNDTFVKTGLLPLTGCTETKLGSNECMYRASPNNILPPVESARLQTRDSFSFRYGTVEIRAKLPIGDWLVPELWLEPKNQKYGPGYASGRIRVAMNRGNLDLNCNGQDLGANILESGVIMGLPNDVQRRSLLSKLPANWHSSFHNYTLKWTPDNISFQIDNEQPQELLPQTEKKLCEIIGFENNKCSTWSTGSKTAPFDQEFYISLGLTVGSGRDFPDGCTSSRKPKPWQNSDPKAMLRFWEDRINWLNTWTEEDSSLYIEYVRVTAL